MKWYIASRTKHKDFIEKIVNHLKSNGHTFVYGWSKLGSLKPYNENSEACSLIAEEISLALKEVEIFILIGDDSGTDMFVELGIALLNKLNNNKIKIYSVGNHNDRSLMHFHPAIKRVGKLEDVFSIESPELLTKDFFETLNLFDSKIS